MGEAIFRLFGGIVIGAVTFFLLTFSSVELPEEISAVVAGFLALAFMAMGGCVWQWLRNIDRFFV